MTHILVRCECGAKLQLEIKVAGKVCRCPKCYSQFTAPEARMFGLNCGRVLSVNRIFENINSEPTASFTTVSAPQRADANKPPAPRANGTAASSHARVREALQRLCRDSSLGRESGSAAVALALHPWPDELVSQSVMDAIAAELLPARNLNHHDIREVAIDRLLRLSESLEYECESSLAARYLDAANQLQVEGTQQSALGLSRPHSTNAPEVDLVSSPLGFGFSTLGKSPVDNSDDSTSSASTELAESLACLSGLGAVSGSMDVGLICGDEPTGVTVQELARRLKVTLPLDRFDKYLGQLSSRDRDILVSRSFVLGPPDTLEEVAHRWKITRERIRQLEVPLKAKLLARFTDTFKRLGLPVLSEYTRRLAPIEILYSAARRAVSGSQWKDTAAAVVLQTIGPWRRNDGWAVHPAIDERVRSLKSCLEKAADAHGLLSNEIVLDLCRDLFRDEAVLQKYAQHVLELGRACGQWTIRDTQKWRIAAALRFLGQPATKDEVAALTGLTSANVGSVFGTLEGVVRADRYRWGFEEWVDDAYDGIFGEIVQRIEECGGSVPLNLILRDIPDRFGVSEASVKSYLATDAFIIEDGFVSQADNNEYTAKSPETCSGAVRIGDIWGQRLPLLERHFMGYSLGVSFDIAYANGVRPDDDLRVPVAGTDYEVSVIWRRHNLNRLIDVGRASNFLKAAGYKDGDDVVVIPGTWTPRSHSLRAFEEETRDMED